MGMSRKEESRKEVVWMYIRDNLKRREVNKPL